MTDLVESVRTLPASFLDAVVDGIACVADLALYAAVDVPGRLDAGALGRALARYARREPVLASRFERHGLWSRFVVDAEPRWPLGEHEGVGEGRAAELEAELVDRRFDLGDASQVHLELLHLEGRDRLLVRASHAIVDGGGMKRLLYGLAGSYREELAGAPLPPRARGGPRGAARLLRAVGPATLVRVLLGAVEDQLSLLPRRTLRVPMADRSDGPRRISRLALESDRLARLRARWRPRRITVNDLLVTAFSRALEACFGGAAGQPGRVGLVITSDLRQWLGPEEHLSNLSNLRVLPVGARPLPGPEALVLEVARRTARWKRNLAGLGHGLSVAPTLALLPHAASRWLIRTLMGPMALRRGCAVALTNMGLISEERLDFGAGPCLDARVDAPVGLPPALIAGATGCAGRLTVGVGYRPLALPAADVGSLLEALDRELARLE